MPHILRHAATNTKPSTYINKYSRSFKPSCNPKSITTPKVPSRRKAHPHHTIKNNNNLDKHIKDIKHLEDLNTNLDINQLDNLISNPIPPGIPISIPSKPIPILQVFKISQFLHPYTGRGPQAPCSSISTFKLIYTGL